MGMYGMMYGYPGYWYPFSGMFLWMSAGWIIQLIIGYLVYRDAQERRMSPVLWLILVIVPMIGWIFLILYLIIRESGQQPLPERAASGILDMRFARGEITAEEYRQMKEELKK